MKNQPPNALIAIAHKHRVLKGGSWATRLWVLRSSFRNWYYPGVRQIFAGFRCAANEVTG